MPLEDRRKSLEEEFFHKENQKKLTDIKQKLEAEKSKEALAKASGMTDDEVLDKLVQLGISADTVTALSLVPLIKVAWADGKMQDAERDAIMQGAAGKGIEEGAPAGALLRSWLEKQPAPSLFTAWESYIKALIAELNGAQKQMLETQITSFARMVAESAGGILGIGKVSDAEKQALAEIEAAFRDA